MPGFAFACSALSGLAAITASTALSIAPVSVTWCRPRALDERARIGATVVGEQHRKHVLGDLAGDDALADEIDERGERRGAQAGVLDGDALRVGVRGEVAHDPVGDRLRVALGAAVLDRVLEKIRRLPLGDEDRGVIGGEPVVGHEAGLLGVRQFRQLGRQRVDESLVELERQEVGIGEIAIVVRLFLGAHRARLAARGIEQPRLLLDRRRRPR